MSAAVAAPPAPAALDARGLQQLSLLVTRSLEEDVGDGDITTLSTVPAHVQATATFLAKEDGVLSGLGVADAVFAQIDPALKVKWTAKEGDAVTTGTRFGTLTGSARSLLVAERLVLNLLQRMSGIATATALYVHTMAASHTRLLDTRKTVPGLRALDKLAVRHGGGHNHRVGLYDMVMIKDNHIEASGGISAAVKAAREYLSAQKAAGKGVQASGADIQIEVEARTLDEVKEVLQCGSAVQRIMLDNMVVLRGDTVDTSMLQEALQILRSHAAANPSAPKLETEASGNVNLKTIRTIAATGVDYISVGALTHSVKALDISMKIKLEK